MVLQIYLELHCFVLDYHANIRVFFDFLLKPYLLSIHIVDSLFELLLIRAENINESMKPRALFLDYGGCEG